MPVARSRAVDLDLTHEVLAFEKPAHGRFGRWRAADVPEANETETDGHGYGVSRTFPVFWPASMYACASAANPKG